MIFHHSPILDNDVEDVFPSIPQLDGEVKNVFYGWSNIGRGEKEAFLSISLTGINTTVAYFIFPLQMVVKKGLFHGWSNCGRVENKVFHARPILDGAKN